MTGDKIWEFQTGAPAMGAITAYRLDGKDYIALVSGGNVWAFALDGKVAPLPAPPVPATRIPVLRPHRADRQGLDLERAGE